MTKKEFFNQIGDMGWNLPENQYLRIVLWELQKLEINENNYWNSLDSYGNAFKVLLDKYELRITGRENFMEEE